MASKKLIIYYISQVVLPIRDRLNNLTVKEYTDLIESDDMFQLYCYNNKLTSDWTKEHVDTFLKFREGVDMSKIEMTTEELQELIVWSFQFADSIGLTLDYLPSELDNELNFKDLK